VGNGGKPPNKKERKRGKLIELVARSGLASGLSARNWNGENNPPKVGEGSRKDLNHLQVRIPAQKREGLFPQ